MTAVGRDPVGGRIRVGVIGCGWWATRAHLPALRDHPEAVIAAIADPDDTNRERAAATFGITPDRAFGDAVQMLSTVQLDAAIVAVPHHLHGPLAEACLDRGLHVLVEKPMTLDPADARDLVARARRAERELIVGYPWHWNPQALALRAAVTVGAIGRLEAVTVLFASIVRELYRGRPEAYRDVLGYPVSAPGVTTYSDPTVAGGGQTQTQLTHAAALLLFVTGLRPAEVAAFLERQELPVDLVDAVAVRFEGGALGTLASTGSVLPGQEEILELRLFGDGGHVLWDVNGGVATIHRSDGRVERLPDAAPTERYPESAPVGNLVDVALGRAVNGSPGELGAKVVELLDGIGRASETGRSQPVAASGGIRV